MYPDDSTFPVITTVPNPNIQMGGSCPVGSYPGITIRYWLAGHAYVPWNAVIETLRLLGEESPTVERVLEYRSKMRFMEADAMLKEGG